METFRLEDVLKTARVVMEEKGGKTRKKETMEYTWDDDLIMM